MVYVSIVVRMAARLSNKKTVQPPSRGQGIAALWPISTQGRTIDLLFAYTKNRI
jgi:hypothetical protein